MNSQADLLVDYGGSLTDQHGRYLRGGQCCCPDCDRMWAEYLADPAGGDYGPDVRWQLCDPATGAVALTHVRPRSFTRPAVMAHQ